MSAQRKIRIVLGVLALALLVCLVAAQNAGMGPWTPGVTQKLAPVDSSLFEDPIAWLIEVNDRLSLLELVALFTGWSLAWTVLVLAVLWISAPWWCNRPNSGPLPSNGPADSPGVTMPRYLALLTSMCLLVAAFGAGPRLAQSLWGDEEYTLRWHVLGYWDRNIKIEGGAPVFQELGYEDAVWGYLNTNNHFLLSITAKSLLKCWQWAGGKEPWEFDERVLRILPFVAGLTALAVWIRIAALLFSPSTAFLAGFLMAVHPWFVRYISEARGYGFVFLFTGLAVLWSWRVFENGSGGRWALWALALFLLVYSWPGAAIAATGTSLALAVLISLRTEPPVRRLQLARWTVTNTVVFTLLLVALSPCIPQLVGYLDTGRFSIPMGIPWAKTVFSLAMAGTDWRSARSVVAPENPLQIDLADGAPLTSLALFGLALFAVVGVWKTYRSAERGRILLATSLLPILSFAFLAAAGDGYLFPWYFVPAVPFLMIAVASGVATIARTISHPGRTSARDGSLLFPAALVAFAGAYLVLVWPKLSALVSHPLDPLRESVGLTLPQGVPDGSTPAIRPPLTAHLEYGALSYDPDGYPLDQVTGGTPIEPSLTALMRRSDEEGRPLFVVTGFVETVREKYPGITRLLDDPAVFDVEATLYAHEPQLVRRVYRYRGGLF